MEHLRQEFGEDPASQEAKLAHDAEGLIAEAARLSELKNTYVDPTSLAKREADYRDGQIVDDLRAAILKLHVAVNPTIVAPEASDAVEVNPRLTKYKEQYDGSGNSKLKNVPWATIQDRILEDEDFQLRAALDLEQGGELFGIDKEGNPLISDGGDEPVVKGMNYPDTRARVHFKHTSNDKAGTMIQGEDGQPISTGYEMFGYVEPYNKSDEIEQYEAHAGKKFVQNSKEYRSSWLESGKNPSWPRDVGSGPRNAASRVYDDAPKDVYPTRGVRRLLRVKKAA